MSEWWLAGAGAAGGALNALLTNNRNLWPMRVCAGARSVMRPGVATSMIIGLAAAYVAPRAFANGCWPNGLTSGTTLVTASAAALIVGSLCANWLAYLADTRLLRIAVYRAASAPAAHPDTVAAMEVATHNGVFEAANRLFLQHRRPVHGERR